MNFERTTYGVLIGDRDFTYLTAAEALDLLDWLTQQRATLWFVSHLADQRQVPASCERGQQAEWSAAEEGEMRSEDEQIACFL